MDGVFVRSFQLMFGCPVTPGNVAIARRYPVVVQYAREERPPENGDTRTTVETLCADRSLAPGTCGRFKNLQGIRKTIIIDSEPDLKLQSIQKRTNDAGSKGPLLGPAPLCR